MKIKILPDLKFGASLKEITDYCQNLTKLIKIIKNRKSKEIIIVGDKYHEYWGFSK